MLKPSALGEDLPHVPFKQREFLRRRRHWLEREVPEESLAGLPALARVDLRPPPGDRRREHMGKEVIYFVQFGGRRHGRIRAL
jgi:hypothetical protein